MMNKDVYIESRVVEKKAWVEPKILDITTAVNKLLGGREMEARFSS